MSCGLVRRGWDGGKEEGMDSGSGEGMTRRKVGKCEGKGWIAAWGGGIEAGKGRRVMGQVLDSSRSLGIVDVR